MHVPVPVHMRVGMDQVPVAMGMGVGVFVLVRVSMGVFMIVRRVATGGWRVMRPVLVVVGQPLPVWQ
jgi:hypothetical protein